MPKPAGVNPINADSFELLGGRVRMHQPVRGYRVSIDAVLAAAAVPARSGQSVLDAGIGTGAITLCLAARVPGLSITGLDMSPEHLHWTAANAQLNDQTGNLQLVQGDLLDPPDSLRRGVFDQIVTNPPYHESASHRSPIDASRAAAGHSAISPEDWIAACMKRLRSGGWLTMIHRADRLDELLVGLHRSAGDIDVLPIWPREDAPVAKRVVLRARKAARGRLRLMRGLVLHKNGSDYTSEAEAVLRHAGALMEGQDR